MSARYGDGLTSASKVTVNFHFIVFFGSSYDKYAKMYRADIGNIFTSRA